MAEFVEALRAAPRPVIMEIKRQDADGRDLLAGRALAQVVADYETAGAGCLSVVTGRWFGGSPGMLREVAALTSIPLLQKDFISSRRQLARARDLGASAVLLTAGLLARSTLGALIGHSLDLGLTPFVEVSNQAAGESVPQGEHCVVAVNNKDIAARERGAADIGRSLRLLPAVLNSGTRCPVSAGGIDRPEVAARLLDAGFAGLLVGTALLRAGHPGDWLAEVDEQRGRSSAACPSWTGPG